MQVKAKVHLWYNNQPPVSYPYWIDSDREGMSKPIKIDKKRFFGILFWDVKLVDDPDKIALFDMGYVRYEKIARKSDVDPIWSDTMVECWW